MYTSLYIFLGSNHGGFGKLVFLSCVGEIRNGHRVLVGKREGKRPLGRSRNEWLVLKWILKK
jgi:hypothetical protein